MIAIVLDNYSFARRVSKVCAAADHVQSMLATMRVIQTSFDIARRPVATALSTGFPQMNSGSEFQSNDLGRV
jgi:hypothetical protein